jgi:hypothetical protein
MNALTCAKLKSIITTSTNQYITYEVCGSLNSGSSCCRSVQNILSSRLSHKNVNIKIRQIKFTLALVHGYESWSLKLMKVQRLSFSNVGYWQICVNLGEGKWQRAWENFIVDSFMKPVPHKISLFSSNQKEWDNSRYPVWEKNNKQFCVKPEERDHLEHTNRE